LEIFYSTVGTLGNSPHVLSHGELYVVLLSLVWFRKWF